MCLDSCHLLASGYEMRDAAAFEAVVDECDRAVGLDRLQALHLNDSKMPLGSNGDRHANLGEGEFGEDGIRVFLGEPRFKGMPVLLEVPGPDGHGPDGEQIEIAKRLRDEAGRGSCAPLGRASRRSKRAVAARPRRRRVEEARVDAVERRAAGLVGAVRR